MEKNFRAHPEKFEKNLVGKIRGNPNRFFIFYLFFGKNEWNDQNGSGECLLS